MSEIDLTYFSLSDEDLLELRNKQDEKLKRLLKCYNEATERTMQYINRLDLEIIRRIKLNYDNHDNVFIDYSNRGP